jgi:hypothetical protein
MNITFREAGKQSVGNTETKAPRVSCRRWIFTLNNYTDKEVNAITQDFSKYKATYIFGKEVGELGTPHLQGYVEFKNPRSLNALKKMNNRIHWEKARGNRQQNIDYCSKDGIVTSNLPLTTEEQIIKEEYSNVTWKPWQQNVIDLLSTEPDRRTINWYWEENGNVGKTFLFLYLSIKYDAIIADGKQQDVFNQIRIWKEKKPYETPKLVLLYIPRYNIEYINYGMLEKIKGGLLYSGKYEGEKIHLKPLHMIVFANREPDYEKMSKDRWRVTHIE